MEKKKRGSAKRPSGWCLSTQACIFCTLGACCIVENRRGKQVCAMTSEWTEKVGHYVGVLGHNSPVSANKTCMWGSCFQTSAIILHLNFVPHILFLWKKNNSFVILWMRRPGEWSNAMLFVCEHRIAWLKPSSMSMAEAASAHSTLRHKQINIHSTQRPSQGADASRGQSSRGSFFSNESQSIDLSQASSAFTFPSAFYEELSTEVL